MNGAGGLVVKALTQHVRDMGLSPRKLQFFQVIIQVLKEIYIYVKFVLVLLLHDSDSLKLVQCLSLDRGPRSFVY